MRGEGGSGVVGFVEHDHDGCVSRALDEADAHCARTGLRFTKVRRRTLEILLESHTALGAYEVLARLERDGLGSQPPLAYRAIAFLVDNGFVHRVERLNAFVACARPGTRHDPAFMICTGCRAVAETSALPGRGALGRTARASGFRIARTVLEAEGLCPDCQLDDAAGDGAGPGRGGPEARGA